MRSTWQRVRAASSRLATEAVSQMEALPWFGRLAADQRADVGLVVQAGIGSFVSWLRDDAVPGSPAPEVFGVAPRELARVVTLKQTVQLIRVVIGVIEDNVVLLAAPGEEQELREAVLRYSREIAFAAAEVYAAAAEARGAWDARLEAGVVEALVRGQVGDTTSSRAGSLGWGQPRWVVPLVARSAGGRIEPQLEHLRAQARHSGLTVLSGEAKGGLVVLLGGSEGTPESAVRRLGPVLPPGPVVIGPAVADLQAAPAAVQEALAGLATVEAWPEAPRPVQAATLLAERAVMGDVTARRRLLEEVHGRLETAGGDLLLTASCFLSSGSSIEATSRALFVHANTVRYRLRKIEDLIGLDLGDARDAQQLRVAFVLARSQDL